MLTKILGFEVRYQLRSPLFVIGFVLFALLGFAFVAWSGLRIEGSGNVLMNGPYGIVIRIASLNLFGLFVFTAFMANVVIRDDETGLAPIIRATRITKASYLCGRFLGAYLVALLVMASVPLGVLLGTAMPWLDQERIGPTVISYYLHAFGVYVAPTVLSFGALFFALATATRSMMWTYVGVVGTLVAWVVANTLLSGPEHMTALALSDPFGVTAFDVATRYWTAAERDTRLPALTGLVLYNRLLWLAVAAAAFAVAYAIFRFDAKGIRSKSAPPEAPASQPASAPLGGARPSSTANSVSQLWALARFDARYVLKSPAFFVVLSIGLLMVLLFLQQTVEIAGTEYLPVTRAVIASALPAFNLFPFIIATYYSGELVWRDREQRIHEIVDATPAPSWTFLLPKMLAIVMILVTSYAIAVASSMLFQLYHGYTRIDVSAYLWWFMVPNFLGATSLAALAVFVQALVPQKFFGWGVMLLYQVARVASDSWGLEHNLFVYNSAPGVPLSDFNGMERFWVARAWFEVFWLLVACMLIVIAHGVWRRGTELRLVARLAKLPQRLRGAPALTLGVATVLAISVAAFILYNTNVLNEYRTSDSHEQWQADLEKTLLGFENVPQPHIVDVKLDVELYPREVRARTTGVYTIENRSSAPLSAVHIHWPHRLQLQQLTIDGGRLAKEYARFDYRIYQLDAPMQPGDQRQIRFTTVLEERGFPNEGALTRIVANGTFLNNIEITPSLGMDRGEVLRDRSTRREYGLPVDLRPAKLEDASANAHNYLRRDSDWVTAEITLTTDADQTPIAPGYTVSDTVNGKRRRLVTRTDSPIMHFFSLQSARYAVQRATWNNTNGTPVDLAVYYHPEHGYNVQRMLAAMQASLAMFSEKFTPFQFRQARILEFPAYGSFAQSFANTVPYAEGIGFIQNYDEARGDETIDLVTYITAHEIAHQWWAHQIIGADKQGSTLLSETFAQYSALLVMEKLYGREQIRKFLKGELDRYLRGRGNEVVEELPLARVENQDHIHYRKGALVMYWLKEVVGEDAVNRALQRLLLEFAFKPAPYPSSTDFLRLLRAEAGPGHEQLITDLFERITLYDMKASDATAKRLPDGKYQVSFTVSAAKLYADGKGRETPAALAEDFEVGAFTVEPGKKGYTSKAALLLERRPMHSGAQTITLVLATLPKYVGVDPYNKRIDRDSNDNLTTVAVQ